MGRLGALILGIAIGATPFYLLKHLYQYAERDVVLSSGKQTRQTLEKTLYSYGAFENSAPETVSIPRMTFHFSATEGTNLWDFSYTDNNEGTNRDVSKIGFYLKNPTNEINFRSLTSNEVVMVREVIGKTLGAYQSSTNLTDKK